MRFEIKSGGIAAIVVCLGILSGTVFVLGLLAGYDVGRQSQIDAAQVAASYPLQPSPGAAATAVAQDAASQPSTNPPLESAAARTKSPGTILSGASAAADAGVSSQSPPAHQRLVSATAPVPTASRIASPKRNTNTVQESDESGQLESRADAPEDETNDSDSDQGRANAAVAPQSRRKPYNIQIQAAMDISGADEMMARLRNLGYPSHLVPTEIDGQRWYKVEVGPYATEEDASNSEAELRQKYDAAYGAAGRGNSAAAKGDNAEE